MRRLLICLHFILIFFLCGCNNKEENTNIDIRNFSELEVIYQYKEYAIAINYQTLDIKQYAIFKEKEYNEYEKVFCFQDGELNSNYDIYGLENYLYIVNYSSIYRIDLETYSIDRKLETITGNNPSRNLKFMKNDDKYLYYQYSSSEDDYRSTFYGKVDKDLSNYILIEKDDLPK